MGLVPEVSLVVKRTFLEFINPAEGQAKRDRAATDTALLGDEASTGVSRSSSGSGCSGQAAATPKLTAVPEPEVLETFGDCVDHEATMEVKAVLGMCTGGASPQVRAVSEPGSRTLAMTMSPQLPSRLQTPQALPQEHPMLVQPQQWFILPASDFQGSESSWGSTWMPAATDAGAVLGGSFSAAGQTIDTYDACHSGGRTTVMLRNLPKALTRDMLLETLDQMGFFGHYDLVYIPVDFSTGCSLGYAFINVATPAGVSRLWRAFDGFSDWSAEGPAAAEACSVSWSEPHQGLAPHIERYRNSPVMHAEVPDAWKPALFLGGVRVAFPPPTRKLKAPKVRSKKVADLSF